MALLSQVRLAGCRVVLNQAIQTEESSQTACSAYFSYSCVHLIAPICREQELPSDCFRPAVGLYPPLPATTMSSIYSAWMSPPLPFPTLFLRKNWPKRLNFTSFLVPGHTRHI